jgi:predicted enzyme related to lactoylglutathione lyase
MHSSRGELGCLRWMELASPGPAAAARFYGELFGWSAHAVELGGTTYRVLEQDDVQVGGIAGPDAPHARLGAQWLPYFRVADCAETSRHAQRLLGTPVTPPTWFSSDVRASVMRDAQGALLGWVEMR